MAEALVSLVVEQLGSIILREIEQEVRLVVGVKDELKKLTSNLTAIKAVLTDAETRQVREATVKDWLEKLKEVTYDIEDVLDDWEAAILHSQTEPGKKVCSFLRSSFCCKQVCSRHDIAYKIKVLNERLHDIAQEKEQYKFVSIEGNPQIERTMTISMIDVTEVKGRDQDKNVLINMLLNDPSDDGDRPDLRVISIVGMGGIGKTTLAQFAFNDEKINTYFDEKIWVCVSDPFDETRVAKAILESLLSSTIGVTGLEGLLRKIRESVQDRKILLVMDDVWEENPTKWNHLKQSLRFGSPGSKVLVTTRKENVAWVMSHSKDDIWRVGTLSDDECWWIVSKIAFIGMNDVDCKNLENIGKQISKKCRGLPLAAKALGGILQYRRTRAEWQSVLVSEIWDTEEAQRNVFAPLLLSYYDLSSELKRCFLYCAIFPKDYEIEKRKLIELWMAQGYLKWRQSEDLEDIGEHYFQNLAMRSFFQDFRKFEDDDQTIYSCKMHDIVHDFAQFVAHDECLGVQVNGPVELIIGSLSGKVRHLSLDFQSSSPFNSFDRTKKMRSLLLWVTPFRELPLATEDLSRLFSESTHVRSLSLKDSNFAEIPPSISKLVPLKWLDLSRNHELKKLPEMLCDLHNLQTINVSGCFDNLELPRGIGKLINLRHLRNLDGPGCLPKGVAQLTGLRTLELVNVGCEGDDAFTLGDLKNLNKLRGRLIIRYLAANSRDAVQAKQAELKKKEHVTFLVLHFTLEVHHARDEVVLEGLEPSPYLEFLSIYYFRGTAFPGWMLSLTNLRNLRISFCSYCGHLPSLGKLPSLETLILNGMSGVRKVGVEFLGIETQIGDSKSQISASSSSLSSSSLPVVVAFPKLTKLEFDSMVRWEEWDDYNDYYDGTAKPAIIMPSLHSLKISVCRRLTALPNYILQNKMLHSLEINISEILAKRYSKEKGEDWSKISHIPHVRI